MSASTSKALTSELTRVVKDGDEEWVEGATDRLECDWEDREELAEVVWDLVDSACGGLVEDRFVSEGWMFQSGGVGCLERPMSLVSGHQKELLLSELLLSGGVSGRGWVIIYPKVGLKEVIHRAWLQKTEVTSTAMRVGRAIIHLFSRKPVCSARFIQLR